MVEIKLLAMGLVAAVATHTGGVTFVVPRNMAHHAILAWDTSQVNPKVTICPAPYQKIKFPAGIEGCALNGVDLSLQGLVSGAGPVSLENHGGGPATPCELSSTGQFPKDSRERQAWDWLVDMGCLSKHYPKVRGRIHSDFLSGTDSTKVAARLRVENAGGVARTLSLARDNGGKIWSMSFQTGFGSQKEIRTAVADAVAIESLKLVDRSALTILGSPLDSKSQRVEITLVPKIGVTTVDLLVGSISPGECVNASLNPPLSHFETYCAMLDPFVKHSSCPLPRPFSSIFNNSLIPGNLPRVLDVSIPIVCGSNSVHRPFCLLAGYSEP